MKILITGGAGFIGRELCKWMVEKYGAHIIIVDKLTYAADLTFLKDPAYSHLYHFEKTDICDEDAMRKLFKQYQPQYVINLAAESHVDKSIQDADPFIKSNIFGTYVLLKVSLDYWKTLNKTEKTKFRFHHVSTDEVFGSLSLDEFADENYPYYPSSPYSASKASADHLVGAWFKTFHLPTVITYGCNNFGPAQFPEKLIPVIIINGILKRKIPLYGSGQQIRDWIFVEDHVSAIAHVLLNGQPGDRYNISNNHQKTNQEMAELICSTLDKFEVKSRNFLHKSLITHVEDRPGHDERYALNSKKLTSNLNWTPTFSFLDALEITVKWYLENRAWWQAKINYNPTHNLELV